MNHSRGSTIATVVSLLLLTAMRAVVTSREKRRGSPDWIRFGVDVSSVYKRPDDWPTRYQPDAVWVPAGDLVCRCPKLRRRRTYLLVGKTSHEVRSD